VGGPRGRLNVSPSPGAGPSRPPEVRRVLERVIATVRSHGMFDPGSRVVVAVSGGPDSVCLLHALARLRRLFRVELTCFHFDHRLREGSDRDATYVRRQAGSLAVPFVARQAPSKPARGESVEAWARVQRYGAIRNVLEELGGGVAAVAHTADDQAETVLLALLRGGGLEALGGMRPVSRPIVRPLLETTRQETVAFCRSLRLRPRRDPMNEDPSFMRVALRSRAIPELERLLGRGVRSTLVRTAALLREDADLLAAMAAEAWARAVTKSGRNVLLDASVVGGLPRPLATRVVKAALLQAGLVPDGAHVDAVLQLARGGRGGRRVALPSNLAARREKGYVRLFRQPGGEGSGGEGSIGEE
jgi:tRNA(Ile)-lysidine synthase